MITVVRLLNDRRPALAIRAHKRSANFARMANTCSLVSRMDRGAYNRPSLLVQGPVV
jgi:hypothetical protein